MFVGFQFIFKRIKMERFLTLSNDFFFDFFFYKILIQNTGYVVIVQINASVGRCLN